MIKWFWTSRLSIKNSLSQAAVPVSIFPVSATERGGNDSIGFKDARNEMAHDKATIWPGLAYSFQVRSTAATQLSQSKATLLWQPLDPSFQALSGRLKFTVLRHKFDNDSFILAAVPVRLPAQLRQNARQGKDS